MANFFLYVGEERSRLALTVFAAGPVLAALLVVWVQKAATAAPLAAAAVVILAGLWLSPSVSPEALAVPIVLAALAAQGEDFWSWCRRRDSICLAVLSPRKLLEDTKRQKRQTV